MPAIPDARIRELVREARGEGKPIERPHGNEAPGLRVRVRAEPEGDGYNASWVWWGPRVDGKRKLHVLGTYPAVSAKEAAGRLADLKLDNERAKAGLPSAEPRSRVEARRMTLRQLLARFAWRELRERRQALAPTRVLKRNVLEVLDPGAKPGSRVEVRALHEEDVINVIQRLQQEHRDPQAKKVFALVKQMLAFAALPTVRAIERSPAENLTERVFRFRKSKRRGQLTPPELADLWRLFHGKTRDPRAETSQLALLILLGTARRTGELVQARWENVDLANAEWRVPRENRKATRELEDRMPTADVVHLPPQVARAFQRLRALAPMSPWVLATPKDSKSGHLGETTLARALADLRKAGLVKLSTYGATPHSFRHAFKSMAQEKHWASVVALELCLGHVLPGIFGTYTLSECHGERAAALDRWCDYLDGLAGFTQAGVVNLDAHRATP
jgi:integrase